MCVSVLFSSLSCSPRTEAANLLFLPKLQRDQSVDLADVSDESFFDLLRTVAHMGLADTDPSQPEHCPICSQTMPLREFASHVYQCIKKLDVQDTVFLVLFGFLLYVLFALICSRNNKSVKTSVSLARWLKSTVSTRPLKRTFSRLWNARTGPRAAASTPNILRPCIIRRSRAHCASKSIRCMKWTRTLHSACEGVAHFQTEARTRWTWTPRTVNTRTRRKT